MLSFIKAGSEHGPWDAPPWEGPALGRTALFSRPPAGCGALVTWIGAVTLGSFLKLREEKIFPLGDKVQKMWQAGCQL